MKLFPKMANTFKCRTVIYAQYRHSPFVHFAQFVIIWQKLITLFPLPYPYVISNATLQNRY